MRPCGDLYCKTAGKHKMKLNIAQPFADCSLIHMKALNNSQAFGGDAAPGRSCHAQLEDLGHRTLVFLPSLSCAASAQLVLTIYCSVVLDAVANVLEETTPKACC